MRNHEIHFKTLTPIWTGGETRNSDSIHETGIIGSMRWWYEGIMRGLGGNVCDVTAEDASKRCALEKRRGETYGDAYNRLCLACRIFGCTGWRRRFRLEVNGLSPQNLFFVASREVYPAAGNWLWRIFGGKELGGTQQGRSAAVTFTFGVQALWGDNATLRIIPIQNEQDDSIARLLFLLDLIMRCGALGAKPQHGFGQIEFHSGLDQELVNEGRKLVLADVPSTIAVAPPDYFNLNSFFSHTYQIIQNERYIRSLQEIGMPPQNFDYHQYFIPCAFDIRYKSRSKDFRTKLGEDFGMRFWFRNKWGKGVAHRLFGRSDARPEDERSAGRIHVSHLYKSNGFWYIKVWGHVPYNLKDNKGDQISLHNVADQVTSFIQKMFPGSKLMNEFNWKEMTKQ